MQDALGRLSDGDKIVIDFLSGRLVVLPYEQPEGLRASKVLVWGLLDSEEIYVTVRNVLSPPLTEMEVLAWAARDL